MRKLQTLLEKEELLRKLNMTNTWISETENDIEELQITHEGIIERIPLRKRLHNFKCFQEKNRNRLDLAKERETQGRNERDMQEKKKGNKETVELNLVHSGLY